MVLPALSCLPTTPASIRLAILLINTHYGTQEVEALTLLLRGYLIGVELVYSVALDTPYGRSPLRGWKIMERDLDLFCLLVKPFFIGKLSIILL